MHSKKLFTLFLCLVAGVTVTGQSITKLDKSTISGASLDKKIESLVKAANVHGLAVTVFNNNEPVYKKTFGYKNIKTKEPIKGNTNIYGASLSKAVFAVLVMKLVEEGVLDLDKPLQDYLPKPIYEYTPTKKWHDNFSDLKNDHSENVPRSYNRISQLAMVRTGSDTKSEF